MSGEALNGCDHREDSHAYRDGRACSRVSFRTCRLISEGDARVSGVKWYDKLRCNRPWYHDFCQVRFFSTFISSEFSKAGYLPLSVCLNFCFVLTSAFSILCIFLGSTMICQLLFIRFRNRAFFLSQYLNW